MSEANDMYLPHYTYEDYKNWEGKWELINGIPYAMSPTPSLLHQRINGKIHIQLEYLIQDRKNCQAFLPVDWRIAGPNDDNVVQPDNLVICKDVEGNFISETPVLIFEILSPSSISKDRHVKYNIYESNGVKYYIIVDIDLKVADVFEITNGSYKKLIEAKNNVVNFKFEEDCSIEFSFEKIWSK